MSISTAEWVEATRAALLGDDLPTIPWRAACLPEHRHRCLAIAAAVTGHVPELAALMDQAMMAFAREDTATWLATLSDLERRVGIAR